MRFWCKFGATLYAMILTIFTISNGTLKTPRDKLLFLIHKKLCYGRAFCYVGAFIERPRATDGRPYGCVAVQFVKTLPSCLLFCVFVI